MSAETYLKNIDGAIMLLISAGHITPAQMVKYLPRNPQSLIKVHEYLSLDDWILILAGMTTPDQCAFIAHDGIMIPDMSMFAQRLAAKNWFQALDALLSKCKVHSINCDEIALIAHERRLGDIATVIATHPAAELSLDFARKLITVPPLISSEAQKVLEGNILRLQREDQIIKLQKRVAELEALPTVPTDDIPWDQRIGLMIRSAKTIDWAIATKFVTQEEILKHMVKLNRTTISTLVARSIITPRDVGAHIDSQTTSVRFNELFDIADFSDPHASFCKFSFGTYQTLIEFLAKYPPTIEQSRVMIDHMVKFYGSRDASLRHLVENPKVHVEKHQGIEDIIRYHRDAKLEIAYFNRTGIRVEPHNELEQTKQKLAVALAQLNQLKLICEQN